MPNAPVELHIVSDATGETATRLVAALEAQFPDQPFEEVRHPRVESVDDLPFGVPDEQVTTMIDARDYLDAKIAAMRAHASQIAVDSPFFALSNGVGQRAFGREYYSMLAGSRGRGSGPHEWESDLFAGID